MPFDDRDCFMEPKKAAMHIWNSVAERWEEWTGTLSVGDVEIGAVEIKDATSDSRATVLATTGQLLVLERRNYTQATATGSAAINTTVTPGVAARLEQLTLHLSAAGGAGNLTVTLDNGTGAAYDAVLLTQDMTSVTDLLWVPQKPILLKATDALVIAWANASSRTYGLEVWWSAL